jgi:hypothetical protein
MRSSSMVRLLALAFAGATLAACGEEGPTDVGAGLLPGGAIRTAEVLIDPARFLVSDTAFSGYGNISQIGFTLVANQVGGALNANTLVRFSPVPTTITVNAPAGGTQVDTMPNLAAARIVVRIDTLRSSPAGGGVLLRLYRAAEAWDRETATWRNRIDSLQVQRPWAQPGGTRGALIAETTWTGGDSASFNVDPALMRALGDTASTNHGAILVTETPGARIRIPAMAVRLSYRSTLQPDTTVVIPQDNLPRTFIFDPTPAAAAGGPRVGGVPGWRTFLVLRERLDTLRVPCPGQPGCTMPLSEATITRAALVLDRLPAPPGFALEDTLQIAARTVLASPLVPLARSPVGELIGVTRNAVPIAETGTTDVTVTEFIRRLALVPQADVTPQSPHLALLSFTEGQVFGFAAFAPSPRLRLVYTVATETQLR